MLKYCLCAFSVACCRGASDPLGLVMRGKGLRAHTQIHTSYMGFPTRPPVEVRAFQTPWGPTRRVGCSTLGLNHLARTHGRFTRRHEHFTKGCSVWWLHRHGGVPTHFLADAATLKTMLGPTRRVGCSRSSLQPCYGRTADVHTAMSPCSWQLDRCEYVSGHKI